MAKHHYPAAFKQEALDYCVEHGDSMTIEELADHLSIPVPVLEKWLKRMKQEKEREAIELKRRIKTAEDEIARLKREMNWPNNLRSH